MAWWMRRTVVDLDGVGHGGEEIAGQPAVEERPFLGRNGIRDDDGGDAVLLQEGACLLAFAGLALVAADVGDRVPAGHLQHQVESADAITGIGRIARLLADDHGVHTLARSPQQDMGF